MRERSLYVRAAGRSVYIDHAAIEVQNWLKLLHFPANFPPLLPLPGRRNPK
jgi:hypothetical protein